MIVEQTNAYAHEVLGDAAGDKWSDVTAEDIRAFLGFALLMGINRLPQLRLYVTIHAKRYHKSAKIFFQITLDFAFIGPSASSLQIWGV